MKKRGFMNVASKLFNNLANGAPKMSPHQKSQNLQKALKALNTLKAGHLSRGLEYGKLKGVCFESDNKDLY